MDEQPADLDSHLRLRPLSPLNKHLNFHFSNETVRFLVLAAKFAGPASGLNPPFRSARSMPTSCPQRPSSQFASCLSLTRPLPPRFLTTVPYLVSRFQDSSDATAIGLRPRSFSPPRLFLPKLPNVILLLFSSRRKSPAWRLFSCSLFCRLQ